MPLLKVPEAGSAGSIDQVSYSLIDVSAVVLILLFVSMRIVRSLLLKFVALTRDIEHAKRVTLDKTDMTVPAAVFGAAVGIVQTSCSWPGRLTAGGTVIVGLMYLNSSTRLQPRGAIDEPGIVATPLYKQEAVGADFGSSAFS